MEMQEHRSTIADRLDVVEEHSGDAYTSVSSRCAEEIHNQLLARMFPKKLLDFFNQF